VNAQQAAVRSSAWLGLSCFCNRLCNNEPFEANGRIDGPSVIATLLKCDEIRRPIIIPMRVATMEPPPLRELVTDLLQQIGERQLRNIEDDCTARVDEVIRCDIRELDARCLARLSG
jgi:hypothetical protein